jgi:hypothetical protein
MVIWYSSWRIIETIKWTYTLIAAWAFNQPPVSGTYSSTIPDGFGK